MARGWNRILRWGLWGRLVCGVVAVAALAAMGRSFYVTDDFCICRGRKVGHVQSGAGFLLLGYEGGVDKSRKDGTWFLSTPVRGGNFSAWWQETCWCWRADHGNGVLNYEVLGFRLLMEGSGQRVNTEIQLPEWAIAVGLAAGAVRGLRRRRVVEEGSRKCVACGYDTRGNVGQCSECGLAVG